jgi:CheY-like chemotaxis protein
MNEAKKILFIDDEAMTLKVGCLMLRGLGYDVTEVQSGYDALELLKANKFDLVLLDLMMPEIYGLDVLRNIRNDKKLKDIPVIIQTGVTNTRDVDDAYEMGVAAVISKPYTKDILREVLGKVLCY